MTDEGPAQKNGPAEPGEPGLPALDPTAPLPAAESASPSSTPAGESPAAPGSGAQTSSPPSWPPAGGSPAPTSAAPASASTASAGPASAPAPDLGPIVVVDRVGHRTFLSAPGDRLVVGADESAAIRVLDPRVGPQHALIVRQGPGWLVTSLEPGNPIWILDATGRPHPVLEELGLRSGTLLAGGTQILLYPPGVA